MTAVLLDLNKHRLQHRAVVPETREIILRDVCVRKLYHTGNFSLYDRSGVIGADVRRIEFLDYQMDLEKTDKQHRLTEGFDLDIVEGLIALALEISDKDFRLLVYHIESISKPRQLGCVTFSSGFKLDLMRWFGLDASRSERFE